ncbi:MAG: hypothetical protein V3V28_09025 [Polaribacter sp.]|uniref:hypothetical protein n=1 Tax=Polaribacter sp. TaxID=1920175 RepID=UPI002F35A253
MKSKDITKALWYNYHNRDFKLDNSFIYSWESDFFSITKTGFAHEIEIKISRSDFLADFKKINKHESLNQIFKGNKLCVFRNGLEYHVKIPITKPKLNKNGVRMRDEFYKIIYENTGVFRNSVRMTKEYNIPKTHQNLDTKLISTSIQILKPKVPNKFYYAVPEGLISKEEVPIYAGLLYINENSIKEIKKAPFIHKEKLDLTKVLLDKFHYLSLRQKNEISFLKVNNNNNKK